MTVIEVSIEGRPTKLLDVTNLRLNSFARLWVRNDKAMFEKIPDPMIELLSRCQGTILDVGPGTGVLLHRFNSEQISVIYGAEPAAKLHPELLKNAKRAGFGEKYHALLCGGEPESLIPALIENGALRKRKDKKTNEEGVFDEICCIRVLCGVPHPQETIKSLYSLLKPGGRMVVCEHVVNPWQTEGSTVARLMQVVYSYLGWPFFMGVCELQRNTWKFLEEAGDWATVDLVYVKPKDVIPFVVGDLIKRL